MGQIYKFPDHLRYSPHEYRRQVYSLFSIILFNYLKTIYSNIKSQYKFDWCKNPETNKYLPFDFVLLDEKIIIELDGIQHFKQVSNWLSLDIQHERDIYKMKCANKNGYSVIRIFQEDVYNNTILWKDLLLNHIIINKNIINRYNFLSFFINEEALFFEDIYFSIFYIYYIYIYMLSSINHNSLINSSGMIHSLQIELGSILPATSSHP